MYSKEVYPITYGVRSQKKPTPMWKLLRNVRGDPLAFRAFILKCHGWPTLHNVIRGAHNLPNRY